MYLRKKGAELYVTIKIIIGNQEYGETNSTIKLELVCSWKVKVNVIINIDVFERIYERAG